MVAASPDTRRQGGRTSAAMPTPHRTGGRDDESGGQMGNTCRFVLLDAYCVDGSGDGDRVGEGAEPVEDPPVREEEDKWPADVVEVRDGRLVASIYRLLQPTKGLKKPDRRTETDRHQPILAFNITKRLLAVAVPVATIPDMAPNVATSPPLSSRSCPAALSRVASLAGACSSKALYEMRGV
ncbi:hypothetical protein V490_04252 [Pseudogymnoascus sp. VKM F-3557]|nr:hypothetical protein V490_04252 [Pseudogymnoascus sp. VKM F-3557]